MTPKEAALVLNVTALCVRRLCREGTLVAEKGSDNRWVIDPASVHMYAKRRKTSGNIRRKYIIYLHPETEAPHLRAYLEKQGLAKTTRLTLAYNPNEGDPNE